MNENINESASVDPRIAFFDHHAATWDNDAGVIDSNTRRLEQLRGMMDLRGGQDLLEVGCGTGQITDWLCSAVAPGRVVAVDFSEEMLERARSKGIAAEFRLLDICSSSPGVGRFDVALCFHSFPHFRDRSAALANISAALKAGGALIVVHLAGSEQINSFHSNVGGAVRTDYLPETHAWSNLLSGAELNLVKMLDVDDLFFLKAVK